ncbi:MAG: hypothetical protein IK065_01845 [Neisseriaceae bacterium]|nr:hypothetical protein [Neisseriaceae bacterium]
MNIKSVFKSIVPVAVASLFALSLAACNNQTATNQTTEQNNPPKVAEKILVGVPNDVTNEARALLLLQDNGLIKLKEGVGLEATANDIADNPYNIQLVESPAEMVSRTLQDVSFAVINGNYALSAKLDTQNVLAVESAQSDAANRYGNVIAVANGKENSPKTVALLAALESATSKNFIDTQYKGSVVALFDGVAQIPDAQGDDTTISIGATPSPHAEILEAVKPELESHGWQLKIVEYQDYIQPNIAVNDGSLDANYFQHQPYLDDYNAKNGTQLVGVKKIHFEPMAVYPGKIKSLDELKK